MTPEEKKMLLDTAKMAKDLKKSLDNFLFIYYQTNFPDKMIINKNVEVVGSLTISNNFTISGQVTLAEGSNFVLGTTTGTKFGTASSQKLAFFGATPIPQQGAITAPATQTGVYVQADVQSIVSAVNSIRTYLTAFGFTA